MTHPAPSRREWIRQVAGGALILVGCTDSETPRSEPPLDAALGSDARSTDGGAQADACALPAVTLHDTYAQALYLDGGNGPLTGTIRVGEMVAGVALVREFWHGHGGQLHRFVLTPTHLAALRRGERIVVGTTMVDDHAHTLFIDPLDETYRVPGAPDVVVAQC